MNHAFMFVLLAITFAFGTVVGDAWTPLSGTHTLAARCAALEARIAELEARAAKLEASFNEANARLDGWLGVGDVRVTGLDGGL